MGLHWVFVQRFLTKAALLRLHCRRGAGYRALTGCAFRNEVPGSRSTCELAAVHRNESGVCYLGFLFLITMKPSFYPSRSFDAAHVSNQLK